MSWWSDVKSGGYYNTVLLKIDYSLMQYIPTIVSSLFSPHSSFPPPLSSIFTPLDFLFRKGQASKSQPNTTEQNAIR